MTALAAQENGLDKEFISDINANAPELFHNLNLSTGSADDHSSGQGDTQDSWQRQLCDSRQIRFGIEESAELICKYVSGIKNGSAHG